MIHAAALLKDLKRLLRLLETDIRERVTGSPQEDVLRADWQAARDAKRTAQAFTTWLDDEVTQAAVHWVLACVFLRFVEDNRLVAQPWLSGPAERLAEARARHEAWVRANPHGEVRDFLLTNFTEAAALPGLGALFDRAHNPLWRLPVSGDGAIALLEFWQRRDPDSGALIHDFTDEALGTRFLGDLYQDLSEAARKRFALLQTPEFVEEFILDRTLDPALREFGYATVRLIDPTCGSGHFLLGAFHRLFARWSVEEPGRNPRDSAQKALDAVSGVDINPFAVAVARFRLLVAALTACGIPTLRDAPDFRISVAVGDSLLHGKRFNDIRGWQTSLALAEGGVDHVTFEEDRAALDLILGRQYHAVVGNPPYITVKDKALNLAYRERYFTCHRSYSLGVPFTERFFDLAVAEDGESVAGFVGLITANSFMKREFGKKLIEAYLPRIDLTHVIDTAGAYIPGHGTPTVILFGRNQDPVATTVRAVMGIKGEPGTPDDPSRGLVWMSIVTLVDRPGSQDLFTSVTEILRNSLSKHPWSMGGGGAVSLKEIIDHQNNTLSSVVNSIGFCQDTHADEAFVIPEKLSIRSKLEIISKTQVRGEDVRDYCFDTSEKIIFPYDENINQIPNMEIHPKMYWFWSLKTNLWSRRTFDGRTYKESGREWYDYHQFPKDRIRIPLSITFAFVATHNHFVFDNGNKVFNRSSPVIKMPHGISEAEHLALLGLLNSSTACFWMKQVFHNKGSQGVNEGVKAETWERFIEFAATGLQSFPLAEPYPTDLATSLDSLARALTDTLPKAVLARGVPTRADLDAAKAQARSIRRRMIAVQEELDFRCYRLYGLIDEDVEHPDPPEVDLGERAFEIVMARKMRDEDLETTWFARHGSTPVTDIPARWPADYRAVVERRIALIEEHRWITLVERPEYKRRWQWDDQGFDAGWIKREQAALKDWLLDRLEDPRYWTGEPALTSVARLAEAARRDGDFMTVAALFTGRPDFQVEPLLADLVAAESAPFLPVLRYSPDGLRKRAAWEETWELQRREDAIDASLPPEQAKAEKARLVGDIPAPPKYKSTDFQKTDYWRLRGGLDVPKERFISYPGAERDADGTLVIAWAGYDHLQQATALAAHYYAMKQNEGWTPDRLTPLLAGVWELVPWLLQWHNAYNPDFGVGLGDYYRSFVTDEARALGLTLDALRAWTPPARPGARRGRR